jgi:transketolase
MAASSSHSPSKLDTGPLEEGRSVTAQELAWRADWIRLKTIDLVDRAGLGHYSSTFSCAEILAVLYYRVLRLWPSRPDWPERDRFLLGKGHVATGLWPVLADLGYFPADWMDHYGKIGSRVNDHPNMRLVPGIDFSSGSLGHNLSVGVGMSLAGRLRGLSYRTFVLTGDGELQEGQVWEAVMAAGHYRLRNLIMVVDANGFSGAGPTSAAMNIEPLSDRLAAFGWHTTEVDGHDVSALTAAFDALAPRDGDRPVGVIARTRKGKGVRMMEESPQSWHLGHLGEHERDRARAEIEARMR